MYKDKNGTILKIGDTIKNNKGVEGKLINYKGVSFFERKTTSATQRVTTPLSKLNFEHFEKV